MKSTLIPFDRRAICLRLVPVTGTAVKLTHHVRNLTMSNGQVYVSMAGHDFTGFASSSSLSASVIDLEGVLDLVGIGRDQLASGYWDNARAYLFATDWNAPVEDQEEITASLLGKATLIDDRFKVEEMSLIDAIGQTVQSTYGPTCPKKFGGTEFGGCQVDLAPITVTGTLTAVTSSEVFEDSARAEGADYFALGTIQFTTGPNSNLKPQEIKSFSAGVITTFEPFYYTPEAGDEYVMIPGCRKTVDACSNKWHNMARFGGFPNVPTSSVYQRVGS